MSLAHRHAWAVLLVIVVPTLAVGQSAPTRAEIEQARSDIKDYYGKGQYEQAAQVCERMLSRLPSGAPGRGEFLNNQGVLYLLLKRYDLARSPLEEAVQVREALKGSARLGLAKSLSNLAQVYLERDEYIQAQITYQRGLSIAREVGASANLRATLHIGLGRVYENMGQFDDARREYEASEAQTRGDRRLVLLRASALNNLGWLFHTQKQFDRAEDLILQALRLREQKLGAKHPLVALSYNNLGLVQHSQRQYPQARKDFEKALAILGERPEYAADRAVYQLNLAALYRSMGEYGQAKTLLDQSSETIKPLRSSDHPERAVVHINRAWLLASQAEQDSGARSAEEFTQAVEQMHQARQGLRLHANRVLAGQSEEQQLNFLEKKDRRWLNLALSLGLRRPDLARAVNRSAEWVLNSKALTPRVLAQRALTLRLAESGDVSGEKRRLARELLDVRGKLAAHAVRRLRSPEEAARARADNDRLIAREQDLSHRLGLALGVPALKSAWVALAQVQQALPADAVLLELARFEPVPRFAEAGNDWGKAPARYAAWVIPARGATRLVDLGEAQRIDEAIDGFLKEMERAQELARQPGGLQGERDEERRARQKLQVLGGLLLKPLAKELLSSSRWIISPDSKLWLFPWGALPVGTGYAVEKHTISYLVSGRDLVDSKVRGETTAAVLFGAIDYGKPEHLFEKLRLSGPEILSIHQSMEKFLADKPILLRGREANREAFRNLHRPQMLVFSTHAYFRDPAKWGVDHNPLRNCGLALAQANTSPEGVVLGQQILMTDLRGTELVVLSACETALGKVRQGEGPVSLQAAFLLAGARTVVGTLWEVPDDSTALVTTGFFKELARTGKEKDKARALQQAQQKVIEDRRELYAAAHPFFWAGIALTGDWK
jgi:CHAT domain-containing protein/Tfp pilus assembly protein PilF